jgi:hypothetical protein
MFLLVKSVPEVAFLNLFEVIAILGYYTTLIGGWLVGWLGWLHFRIGYRSHLPGSSQEQMDA